MKTYKVQIVIAVIIGLLSSGCISDDEFDRSPFNDIKTFQLPGQAGLTAINREEKSIIIPMSEEAELSDVVPSNIEISNLATISPSMTSPQNFNEPVVYEVRAENNEIAIWTVTAIPALPNPQLPNSNFDQWYTVGNYQQPGESADNTVWGTANRALALVGEANTNPIDLGNGDFAAKLTSEPAPLLVRMAAATLFTGTFTQGFPSPTDPRSNIDFGTPFSGRPEAFRVDYRYLPGESYEDADGNPLSGSDQCDIYVLLEKREGENVQRIGTGWLRSDNIVQDWSTVEVPIIYGELNSSDPQFEYANIRPGETWGQATDIPTHIIVVFSSSALGDFFTGAIGSELWVNNFELMY